MTVSGQSAASNIAWIDLETDGLKYFRGGHVLEVACVITDSDLNVLDEGHPFHAVVYYSPSDASDMRYAAKPIVQEMHDKTDLWDLLSGIVATPLDEIDTDLRKYLQMFDAPGNMPVGGNSVRLDLNFIEDLFPETYSYLNYQMRDMTSLGKFVQAWFGVPPFEKAGSHTALGDIIESIAEARYYRDAMAGFGS